MASASHTKPTRRTTVKAAAKARQSARTVRGPVKAARAKSAPPRSAKPKSTQGKRAAVKVATAKAAPSRSRSAVTAKTTKPVAPRATTARTARPVAGSKANGKLMPAAKNRLAKPAMDVSQSAGSRPAPAKAVLQPPVQGAGKPAIDQAARDRLLAREHASTAVNRALSLLETLARTGPVPIAVLADAAGCGKTAALELLTTMQSRSFVIQDEARGLWQLGARWSVLGSAASEQGALAATAMPYLAALGNATGENVYLRVREGMECETVAIYQTDPSLRVYTEVGKKMPLHAGSGRLLLAHAPEAVQTQVLAQRLQHYTPSTRTDPSWIAADLHRIRSRGFLITDSEVVAGTVSVCAPVRDASGQVVAGLLIGSPSLRMRPPRPRALLPIVMEAARKLSHALGSISEQPATPAPVNGALEGQKLGAISGAAWPAAALGAAISRPHSIFR